jgi:uncharacterized ion transporter superfamily protein YfcC
MGSFSFHKSFGFNPYKGKEPFFLPLSNFTHKSLHYRIQVVLGEGGVVDTMVYGLSIPVEKLPGALSAVGMFFVQTVVNFFIPSGSSQAFVTMPIMAPLSDLVGVSRQVGVLAFQFGDGFSNILIPTQYVLIGILAMAGIPYDRWLRFILPFMVKITIVGSIALAVAVLIRYV